MQATELPVAAEDGHRWSLLARIPDAPRASLLWIPALGIAARHYLPFAEALAEAGIASFVHEWRGHGSSSLRASRAVDWGYRELLQADLPASAAAIARACPGLPRITGGHSLGGQLACCAAALAPQDLRALWLVGSGAPYWRAFPRPLRYGLPLLYRFLPWLADRAGALPGRRIGFGGNEARGVIRDWARSGLSGRYAATGIETDIESALAGLHCEVRAVRLTDDRLGPAGSLAHLLDKLPDARIACHVLDAAALGAPADHYAWMRQPRQVVAALAESATRG